MSTDKPYNYRISGRIPFDKLFPEDVMQLLHSSLADCVEGRLSAPLNLGQVRSKRPLQTEETARLAHELCSALAQFELCDVKFTLVTDDKQEVAP